MKKTLALSVLATLAMSSEIHDNNLSSLREATESLKKVGETISKNPKILKNVVSKMLGFEDVQTFDDLLTENELFSLESLKALIKQAIENDALRRIEHNDNEDDDNNSRAKNYIKFDDDYEENNFALLMNLIQEGKKFAHENKEQKKLRGNQFVKFDIREEKVQEAVEELLFKLPPIQVRPVSKKVVPHKNPTPIKKDENT